MSVADAARGVTMMIVDCFIAASPVDRSAGLPIALII
jgi:hypothetical protein